MMVTLIVDPVVGGEVVAAGVGCDIPFLRNPYGAAPRFTSNILTMFVASVFITGFGLLVL